MTCRSCEAQLPDGARFCPACGAAVEEVAGDAEERKLATVLFADLVGSTTHADAEDPERVRALLERFYDAMSEEIVRTGGTVETFAGDSVMAAFGAPAALEDHAERALHAALAMQRRLAESFGGVLALRIGVNTGDVVAGRAREGTSFVTGDAVNVGARLEQAAAPGEILAGDRTVAAARGAFEFGEERVVEAKGKPGGVACRPVLRALSLMRPRGVGGLQRVFVGRDSELELLRATFRRAVTQAEPHLVTVVGEPGVGKTRLMRELWEALADEEPSPARRTGRCLAYGEGITYWPLGEIVREHFGIHEGEAPEAVRARLGGREILGLALGLDVARGAHPLEARERLHEAVVALVEEISGERPLVLLVEDVHWAEDDLLDLLERVARDVRGPALVLTTARPELFASRSAWGAGRRNATTIWLEPLLRDDTARMLEGLLSVDLPPGIEELVVERAEGNPFFVEELVGELVEAGVLERGDGGWGVRELPEGFSVPDSVHAVLAARIDRLPAVEKAALQAASVVGRLFWSGPVVHLLEGTQPRFELLEERDFLRSRSSSSMKGEREYAIKHALTREVAYSTIPKARRARLHASLARWLEARDPVSDEHASLLAYHFSQAVEPQDADLAWGDEPEELERLRASAIRWLWRAGELAAARYELDEAVELLNRALELSGDEGEKSQLLRALGRTHAYRYDGDAMRTTLLRALDGPLDDAGRADTYAFMAFQASIRSAMWSIKLDSDLIEDWVRRALELAPPGSDAEARALVALANLEPTAMREDELTRIEGLTAALGDVQLRSHVLGARSCAAFEARRFADAVAWSDRRLELLVEVDDADQLCEAYESGVPVAAAVGRLSEARRLADLHAGLARRLSAHHRVHSVSLPLEIGDALGDWEALAGQTGAVVDAVEANLATPCVRNPRGLLLLALAHLVLGDETRAGELEREAERVAGQGYDSYLSAPRIRMALERGDRASVEALAALPLERTFVWGPGVFATRLDALVALGRRDAIEAEAPGLLQEGTLLEPFALRALAAARRDDELLARADARFAALGLEWHRSRTERLLAGV